MKHWPLIASILAAIAIPALAEPTTQPGAARPKAVRQPNASVTPVAKDTNRHAEFLMRIQQGPVGLLFLGDSIMDAWPRRGEFHWLKFAPYQPADFGIGYDKTEHVLWRIEHGELDGIAPKVVVLLVGTNNIGNEPIDTPAQAAAGIARIVQTIHTKLPQTKVLLLGVLPRGDKGSPQRLDVGRVDQIIRKLDDGSLTRYLDLGPEFLAADGSIPHDLMADALHPTAKGYARWYETMQPLLDEMMR